MDEEYFETHFKVYSRAVRQRLQFLRTIPTVEVDRELVEWNYKFCFVLELRALQIDSMEAWRRMSVNPLAGVEIAFKSIGALRKHYPYCSSLDKAVVNSLCDAIGDDMKWDDLGKAIAQEDKELVAEKYRLFGTLSNRYGVTFPLDDDGCPIVTSVSPGSTAESIGLQVGDVLLSYGGTDLSKETDTVNVLYDSARKSTGRRDVEVRFLRNGEVLSKRVRGGMLGLQFCVSPVNWPEPWKRHPLF